MDAGFADELEEGKQIAACVSPEFFAKYKHPPESLTKAEEPKPEEAADEGGFLMPVKQGEQQPVSDTTALDAQKRRFELNNKKFKIVEV